MIKQSVAIYNLQKDISAMIKKVEKGAVFEVMRYSKPVAVLLSIKEYERICAGEDCKKCVTELREIAKTVKR